MTNVLRQFQHEAVRLMTAVTTGVRSAVRTYREQDYVPLAELGYDTYAARQARYWRYAMYRDNTLFTVINNYALAQRERSKLYKHIRGVYNPVARLVNLEIAKVYGGSLDWQGDLRTGAIPIVGADETLLDAIKLVLKWSNFGAAKSLYVRNGATYGDSFLKVVNDPVARKVRLEVLDPRKVKEMCRDSVGNITEICIEYTDIDHETGKEFTYREEMEKDGERVHVATFKNDEPFAYNDMGLTEWDEPFSFVPVRQVQHRDMGLNYGATSFADSLAKIDEANDMASNIHDAIRKIVNPIWSITGTYQLPANTLTVSADERDQTPFITLPAGSTISPMIAPLAIADAIATLDKQLEEVERDMPQLALQKIRDKGGDPSGVSIVNSYSDASDLIIETQGNYDAGLIASLQMAITMGGVYGY